MVKLEAASISNHKVLIVAEETMLSVYRSAHMIASMCLILILLGSSHTKD